MRKEYGVEGTGDIAVEKDRHRTSPYGPVFTVKTVDEFYRITCWMRDNRVAYVHEYSTVRGYGFSVQKNLEWFAMRWL